MIGWQKMSKFNDPKAKVPSKKNKASKEKTTDAYVEALKAAPSWYRSEK